MFSVVQSEMESYVCSEPALGPSRQDTSAHLHKIIESAVVRGLNVARSLRIKATFGTHLSESSTQVKRFKILTAILDVLYLDHDQLC